MGDTCLENCALAAAAAAALAPGVAVELHMRGNQEVVEMVEEEDDMDTHILCSSNKEEVEVSHHQNPPLYNQG